MIMAPQALAPSSGRMQVIKTHQKQHQQDTNREYNTMGLLTWGTDAMCWSVKEVSLGGSCNLAPRCKWSLPTMS